MRQKKYKYIFYCTVILMVILSIGLFFVHNESVSSDADQHSNIVYSDVSGQEVRIGVLANQGDEKCMKLWGATAKYLNEKIKDHKFFIVPLGFDEINQSVESGDVDFALVNPSIYVELEMKYDVSRLITLKSQVSGKELIRFGGVIFTSSTNVSSFFKMFPVTDNLPNNITNF